MNIKESFGLALQLARKSKEITQEGFSNISSRTYVSTLERGLCSPTIEKVDLLASTLGMHPLTLLSMAYIIKSGVSDVSALMDQVKREIVELNS
jgi:transcriptional regulator with XRE-family HTH domain